MANITIYSEKCDCLPGQCASFLDDDTQCINRLDGEVVTKNCPVCSPSGSGATWHHNGACLKCRHNQEIELLAKEKPNGR